MTRIKNNTLRILWGRWRKKRRQTLIEKLYANGQIKKTGTPSLEYPLGEC